MVVRGGVGGVEGVQDGELHVVCIVCVYLCVCVCMVYTQTRAHRGHIKWVRIVNDLTPDSLLRTHEEHTTALRERQPADEWCRTVASGLLSQLLTARKEYLELL